MNIVLASTSPIRRQLLQQAGITFTCSSPAVDESTIVSLHPDWTPETISSELAAAKAIAVSQQAPQALVIGADQVLSHRGKPYAKPASLEACRNQLRQLRDDSHQLISTVCVAFEGELAWSHTSLASLTMRPFSEQFLDAYLSSLGAGCLTSVGGYKLESLGVQLFDRIEGDYFAILGLPLLPLLGFLRQTGAIAS